MILLGSMKNCFDRELMNFHMQVLRMENVSNDDIFSEVRTFWNFESVGILDERIENRVSLM